MALYTSFSMNLTINPRYTSQTCHQCGEKGNRKGGEHFYCSHGTEHFHADVNAARNIIHVQDSSTVSGGTEDTSPSLSSLQ
ncbi:MAG: zinc ribbon domain-containing protein [Candidatus Thorarchaeota archaeon]